MASGDARSVPESGTLSSDQPTEVEKSALLCLIVGTVFLTDLVTKQWIVSNYVLYQSDPVLGDFFRITYTHNPGAAFGLSIGEHSRVFFLVLSLLALGVLVYLYRVTPRGDRLRLIAISLVAGGAVGNIVDRLRYERGVVDFLDFGIGEYRWYVFNVADMAVSAGAILLLISFYREERRHARRNGEGSGERVSGERARRPG